MLSLQILSNIFILLHVTPYHCKKGIPYSQTLRLNRICSDSISFDRRCNDLERLLLERGYKEREVRKQLLRGRAFCRDDLLNRERTLQEKTFNLHLI